MNDYNKDRAREILENTEFIASIEQAKQIATALSIQAEQRSAYISAVHGVDNFWEASPEHRSQSGIEWVVNVLDVSSIRNEESITQMRRLFSDEVLFDLRRSGITVLFMTDKNHYDDKTEAELFDKLFGDVDIDRPGFEIIASLNAGQASWLIRNVGVIRGMPTIPISLVDGSAGDECEHEGECPPVEPISDEEWQEFFKKFD